MAHPVVWFEVLGADGERLRQFYGEVFRWTFDTNNPMKYGMVDTGDKRGILGGVGEVYPGSRPWVTFYVETPDVAATLAHVERLGGKVVSRTQARYRRSPTRTVRPLERRSAPATVLPPGLQVSTGRVSPRRATRREPSEGYTSRDDYEGSTEGASPTSARSATRRPRCLEPAGAARPVFDPIP